MSSFVITHPKVLEDYIEFEKGIFDSFSKRNPSNWITRNYEFIDGCRYKPKIDYKDQRVYLVKENTKLIAGFSVNLNLNQRTQLEDIGFELESSERVESSCEALILFTLRNTNISPFEVMLTSREYIVDDMKKIGIKKIWGTCSHNLLNFYTKFGFELVEEKINYENEKKYLLIFNV